jgi:hypothetical protein
LRKIITAGAGNLLKMTRTNHEKGLHIFGGLRFIFSNSGGFSVHAKNSFDEQDNGFCAF